MFDKVAERDKNWIEVIGNTGNLRCDLMGNGRLRCRYPLIDVSEVPKLDFMVNVPEYAVLSCCTRARAPQSRDPSPGKSTLTGMDHEK